MTQRFFRKLGLALGCLALVVPPAAVARPLPQSAPTRLPAGTGEFMFDAWAGPQLKVWTYVPDGIDPATAPILIVMHGVNRDADRYLAQWRGPASACGFVVIAPEFSRSRFRGSNEYNLGHVTAPGQRGLRPRERRSFAAIEPLFDEVVTRLGGGQQGYTLYGHSAGSQFVHRLLLTGHAGRARRILAANAGWYTLPTLAQDYPFGLNGTGVEQDQLKAALAHDMVILLGDRDTDIDDPNLNTSAGAMKQGPHRFARGRHFHAMGEEAARQEGWQFGWTLREVHGVAHDNGGIARASGALVAGVTECRAAQPDSATTAN